MVSFHFDSTVTGIRASTVGLAHGSETRKQPNAKPNGERKNSFVVLPATLYMIYWEPWYAVRPVAFLLYLSISL